MKLPFVTDLAVVKVLEGYGMEGEESGSRKMLLGMERAWHRLDFRNRKGWPGREERGA